MQVIFVTFGFRVFNTYKWNGLTVEQWFICYAFAFGGLIWSMLVKFFPERIIFEGIVKAFE
jgi:hypothetical protein